MIQIVSFIVQVDVEEFLETLPICYKCKDSFIQWK